MEGEFENSGGVLVKNEISGFERDGDKAEVHDINFINVIAGNQLITNANAGNYFDIDPNTTYNINFTTQGNIYDITTGNNAGGSLRPSGVVPTPAGMERFISIIPNAGKKIVDVKVDGVSVGRKQNVYFANMSANHTVDVTFGNGDDHFGNAYSCSTGDTTPPAVPTGLVVTGGNNQVSLDWDDNAEPDFSHYVVRRNTTGVAPWGGAIATPSSSDYVDTTAVNGTTYYYAIRAEDTSGNKSNNGNVASATPAGGAAIPAQIEAENYDNFYDLTAGNAGDPSCSSTDVDAETTSDTGGGCNIGWTDAGEWLEYDINSSGGTFDLVLRLASNKANKTVTVKLNGNVVGTVTAPSTGWQSWGNRTISNVNIPAGPHTLRVEMDTGKTNFNYIDIQ